MENTNISPQNFNKNIQDRNKIKDGTTERYAVTVLAEPEIVYEFWRDFGNFPLFMKHVSEVEVISPIRSHWIISLDKAPNLEWDAEIINEKKGEMIAWQSVGDATIKQAGSVWFRSAPANRGTIVSLSINYSIPGGKISELAGKLLGEDPKTLILTELRNFKSYMETGEIPTTENQPTGKDKEEIKLH